jgi:hypothetical protein
VQKKLLRITRVDFDVIDQRLIKFSIFGRHYEKLRSNVIVHQIFINFKQTYDSVRRKVFHNISIGFGISRRVDGLIKMCFSENKSTLLIGKVCLTGFLFRMAWNKETIYRVCFLTLLWNTPLRMRKRTIKVRNWTWNTSCWPMLMTLI